MQTLSVKRVEGDSLGVFDVGGSLREVSLLLVEEAQLVEREGNQVVVVPDAPLTEDKQTGYIFSAHPCHPTIV